MSFRAGVPRRTVLLSVSCVLFSVSVAAQAALYQPNTVHDVDLLPNGNILVTDGGSLTIPGTSGVYEIDRSGNILWSYATGLYWAHNADQQTDGSVIISDTNNNRVLIVSAGGAILWNSDSVTLSDGSALNYPNDANLLAGGNSLITDRNNHRVIEVNDAGTIIWQFGQTGVPGGGATRLNGPHNADRLDNGNTIIADSNNRRIIEVTTGGNIVWTYGVGLNWPRDADRLTNGNTLINDSNNRRIIEVTSAGTIVWSYAVTDGSYDSDRLAGGNTLLSEGSSMKEVDSSGTVVWSYPSLTAPEVVWITNPTSGVDLYCHIHRPANFSPTNIYPGIILCPGGSGTGTSFDNGNTAQNYAELGFIVMHFDPDGRGQSTNGGTYTTEDYCGYLQQDGAHAVLQYLVDLPETDNRNIGVVTSSYGITLGAGTVGRYPNSPQVKFLLDWEGPADRTDTAQPNGHVPHSTSDDVWWYEREPTNFIDDFAGYYLRIQTQIDHVQADNEHAIKLLNRAANTNYGGFGLCLWTRCNSQSGVTNNLPNAAYSYPTNQPQYLAEGVNLNQIQQQYLVELAGMPAPQTYGDFDGDGDVDLADFAQFENCFTGPGGTLAPGCEPGDFDLDNDIDCDDWAQIGLVWTDPGQPPQLAQCSAVAIPTVSQWGLVTLTMLLMTAGTAVIRRTRHAQASGVALTCCAVLIALVIAPAHAGAAQNPAAGGFVLVTERAGTTVAKINVDTDQIIGRATVGNQPSDLAADAVRRWVYVAAHLDHKIVVMKADALETADLNIPGLGKLPIGVEITPDGGTLLVTTRGSDGIMSADDRLDVIRLNASSWPPTGSLSASISTGVHPIGACLARDGRHAVVTVRNQPAILIVDLQTNQIVGQAQNLPLDAEPEGCDAHPTANVVYVTLHGPVSTVEVFDLDTLTLVTHVPIVHTPPARPSTGVFTPDGGRFYVSGQTVNKVFLFETSDPLNPVQNMAVQLPVGQQPHFIVYLPGDRAYVANTNNEQPYGSLAIIHEYSAVPTVSGPVLTTLAGPLRFVKFSSPGSGDFDSDGDVDADDAARFETCFTGENAGPIDPGCEPGDFDGDSDIDCDDWAQFGLVWTGPGQLPELSQCASQAIPTISQWGLVTLTLLLMTAATVVIRQTRPEWRYRS